MSKKRILFVGGNFYPEATGIGKYNGEMVDWLASKGFECTVITTYPYYPHWKVQQPYSWRWFWYKTEIKDVRVEGGNNIKIYRCPHYVPRNPSGIKRIMLDFSFSMSCFIKMIQILPTKKFDIVITVVPPFHLGLLAVLYKKFRNAKFFYHIQDLQIEAARDLQMIKSERVIKTLFNIERYIINKADTVSSISDGMINKIRAKSGKDIKFFPNWANIEAFYPITDKSTLKAEFGFEESDKIVLYSGAIGEKQGLEAIILTADKLKAKKYLKFVICGSGPYKENLKAMAEKMNLSNVVFYPLQPFDKFNNFLNVADLHLVIQKTMASDLVMPSKLTTILAVGGVALITANLGSSLYDLVDKYKVGYLVDSENQDELTNAIEKIIDKDNSNIAQNARVYAENYLSIDKVLSTYMDMI